MKREAPTKISIFWTRAGDLIATDPDDEEALLISLSFHNELESLTQEQKIRIARRLVLGLRTDEPWDRFRRRRVTV